MANQYKKIGNLTVKKIVFFLIVSAIGSNNTVASSSASKAVLSFICSGAEVSVGFLGSVIKKGSKGLFDGFVKNITYFAHRAGYDKLQKNTKIGVTSLLFILPTAFPSIVQEIRRKWFSGVKYGSDSSDSENSEIARLENIVSKEGKKAAGKGMGQQDSENEKELKKLKYGENKILVPLREAFDKAKKDYDNKMEKVKTKGLFALKDEGLVDENIWIAEDKTLWSEFKRAEELYKKANEKLSEKELFLEEQAKNEKKKEKEEQDKEKIERLNQEIEKIKAQAKPAMPQRMGLSALNITDNKKNPKQEDEKIEQKELMEKEKELDDLMVKKGLIPFGSNKKIIKLQIIDEKNKGNVDNLLQKALDLAKQKQYTIVKELAENKKKDFKGKDWRKFLLEINRLKEKAKKAGGVLSDKDNAKLMALTQIHNAEVEKLTVVNKLRKECKERSVEETRIEYNKLLSSNDPEFTQRRWVLKNLVDRDKEKDEWANKTPKEQIAEYKKLKKERDEALKGSKTLAEADQVKFDFLNEILDEREKTLVGEATGNKVKEAELVDFIKNRQPVVLSKYSEIKLLQTTREKIFVENRILMDNFTSKFNDQEKKKSLEKFNDKDAEKIRNNLKDIDFLDKEIAALKKIYEVSWITRKLRGRKVGALFGMKSLPTLQEKTLSSGDKVNCSPEQTDSEKEQQLKNLSKNVLAKRTFLQKLLRRDDRADSLIKALFIYKEEKVWNDIDKTLGVQEKELKRLNGLGVKKTSLREKARLHVLTELATERGKELKQAQEDLTKAEQKAAQKLREEQKKISDGKNTFNDFHKSTYEKLKAIKLEGDNEIRNTMLDIEILQSELISLNVNNKPQQETNAKRQEIAEKNKELKALLEAKNKAKVEQQQVNNNGAVQEDKKVELLVPVEEEVIKNLEAIEKQPEELNNVNNQQQQKEAAKEEPALVVNQNKENEQK